MNKTRTNKRVRLKPWARKRSLIVAGIICVKRDGFENLTGRSVAREAGVSASLISCYFGNIDGFIYALIDHLKERRDKPTLKKIELLNTPYLRGPIDVTQSAAGSK